MALTDKLTAIAAAIREKGGTTEKLTLDAMAAAIAALEVGGGGSSDDGVPNPITITGTEASGVFKSPAMNWVINNYGNRIQTTNLSSCLDMFSGNRTIEEIPFDFNFSTTDKCATNSMLQGCYKLKTISGDFNNLIVDSMRYMFYDCHNLRELPTFNNIDCSATTSSMAFGDIFRNCYSLRSIPESLLKKLGSSSVYNVNGTVYNGLANLYTIDEIVGIPTKTKEMTSNVFTNAFSCYRVKRFVFDKQVNGNPYVVSWKNQTLNLYDGFGWLSSQDRYITGYNSGITADKKVYDSLTYQALKNDADWYTGMPQYSRFNHDSAVEMINSLPDTSAYLSTNGGTNTIKLRNGAGALTDGGSCGSLTEEEIAVATAKGWTITYEI